MSHFLSAEPTSEYLFTFHLPTHNCSPQSLPSCRRLMIYKGVAHERLEPKKWPCMENPGLFSPGVSALCGSSSLGFQERFFGA